ncbi:hypothetical protein MYAM1_000400 [Malassezia yamatoensis]|uniref:Uncharacterized protein n=1 Tax=Malassezia yamatoensis TaxID=253288 RepID=A0AAJ5YPF4_9BASI|nr:hypothetical protein MYAM1_000400 [Malassezia yamatoensis]
MEEAPPAYQEAVPNEANRVNGNESTSYVTSTPSLPPRPQQSEVARVQSQAASSRHDPPTTQSMSTTLQTGDSRPSSSTHESMPVGPLPTSVPQDGHPFLYEGKLLVFPRSKPRCEKCGNTGYKGGDPNRSCSRCWRKYGRKYNGALKMAYEGNPNLSSVLQDVEIQRPLPTRGQSGSILTGYTYPANGLQPSFGWPSANYPPFASPYQVQGPNMGYLPSAPQTAPSNHAGITSAGQTQEERFPEDQHDSAPPLYQQASSTSKPLPEQAYLQHQAPSPQPPFAYSQSSSPYPVPGQWGHTHMAPGPTYNWYGNLPPQGALAVAPGDPRIGGVLCPECGGSGNSNNVISMFFGDEECLRCSGAGRITEGFY